jgi:hypothetical protein
MIDRAEGAMRTNAPVVGRSDIRQMAVVEVVDCGEDVSSLHPVA